MAKKALKEKGVLSMGFDYSQNYIGEIRRKKLSAVFNTVREYFEHVLIIPGEKAYFICSDHELTRDIPARLKSKSIPTKYIDAFFYGNVSSEKIEAVNGSLYRNEPVNTDFKPRLMSIVFQEWFAKHGGFSKYFLLVLPAFMMACLVFMKKEQYVVFSTGVVSMGAEMLIIFSFQIIYGYVYQEIGAIVTAFLLGLLPGALMGNRKGGGERYRLVMTEGLLMLMLLIFFLWVQWHGKIVHRLFFLLYCFIFSFICGYQFPVAARIIGERKNPAAVLFSSDLSGASMGTIITGTLLIPLFGMGSAVVFLIAVKLSSLMMFILRKGGEKH
jgi:spermidine synthase